MNENTGFEAFCMFNAMKLHFSSDSYDYIKYNGKTSVSKDSFMKRKDKFSFYKLSRKYNNDELRDYLIANFVYNNFKWVGDLLSDDAVEAYNKWQKNNQSLSYLFENDLDNLFDKYTRKELLAVSGGSYPKLLTSTMQNDIIFETLVILNEILNFFPMWDNKITDTIVWPVWKRRCLKYAPFINYDINKFKSITRGKIKEHAYCYENLS